MLWIEHVHTSTEGGRDGLMDAGSNHSSAAKGSDLEVTGSDLVSCCFSIPVSFFTICSSLPCLSDGIIVCTYVIMHVM